MDKDLEHVLNYAKIADVLKLTRNVIDIPSPVGSEGKLGEYLLDTFTSWGLKTYRQEVEEVRPSDYATADCTLGNWCPRPPKGCNSKSID
jgi:hypothetical protein